jgi:hypothetical protein
MFGKQARVEINSPRCNASINYQGRLTNMGANPNSSYDFQFTVFNAVTDGASTTPTVTMSNVPVTNGIFSVNLNFGSALWGNEHGRFLEISVRQSGANPNDPFTKLSPRQTITHAPFAINSQYAARADYAAKAFTAENATNAASATNAAKLGGVDSSGFVQSNSTAFIRNQTDPQTGNFNISGNGTVGGNLTANLISGNGAGLTGIFTVYSLNQSGVSLPSPNPSGYSFIGQTQTATLAANNRLTGSGSIPLAVSSGTTVVRVGLCYSLNDGEITNFAGAATTNTIIDGSYTIYPASATVQPGAGQVKFGLCVGNFTQPLLSNSVNGWVMMTNN